MVSEPGRRAREGSFYLIMIVGAILALGLILGLQIQMDQQMARARRLKGSAEAALIARWGVEEAGRRLASAGALPARFTDEPEGGELVVAVEGPRPASSRKYIVFGRARFSGATVTAVADIRFGSPNAEIYNLEMLYQDIDVDSAPARARVVGARRAAKRALKTMLTAYRSEGAGLRTRLGAFLAAASLGTIPRGDQTRMLSALPAPLTTDVP